MNTFYAVFVVWAIFSMGLSFGKIFFNITYNNLDPQARQERADILKIKFKSFLNVTWNSSFPCEACFFYLGIGSRIVVKLLTMLLYFD